MIIGLFKKCKPTDTRCTGNSYSTRCQDTLGRTPRSILTFEKARAGDPTRSLNDSAHCPQIKTR